MYLERRIVRSDRRIVAIGVGYRRAGSVEKIVFCYAKGRWSNTLVWKSISSVSIALDVRTISLDGGIARNHAKSCEIARKGKEKKVFSGTRCLGTRTTMAEFDEMKEERTFVYTSNGSIFLLFDQYKSPTALSELMGL